MHKNTRGSITPALLVITGAFVTAIYGLLMVIALQLDFSHRQVASQQALSIAEAGINYYKWHLAHAPEDFMDGTGTVGPYIHTFADPQGGNAGSYSLTVTPPTDGSTIVTLTSTGWTDVYPSVKRTITATYGRPSYARFSFLTNASSWYGAGITVNGAVHSNTGIRMDGVNTSLVTSAVATYLCGSETGCSPAQSRPGVWGSGPGGAQGLWQFPVPAIDFNSISFDFNQMKLSAQSDGLWLANSGASGYHLVFLSNGTVNISRVTSTNYYNGMLENGSCPRLYQRITNESFIGNYTLADTPIIFVEDALWVEGVVNGKTTVAAVQFPISSTTTNVWIRGNLYYNAYDNSDELGLIAQDDIYFARDIPNDFRVDGALMAQSGKIIRHGYVSGCGYSSTYSVRNSLTINGALISFNKSYWNWGSGPTSGFRTRTISYDSNLLYMPPPYFPTSGEYEFISWAEE